RYANEYGEGLTITPPQAKLRTTVTPASASFGESVEVAFDIPDIDAAIEAWSKVQKIGDSCLPDLDAFSRWIGRNEGAARTVGAVALLPRELATKHESDEASALWQWVTSTVGVSEAVVVQADDVLQRCTSFGAGKLAKSETVLLAQLLEKGGYGIEPDVRFGG